MLSCEMNIIKYLLFAFNLIFALTGIGIIVAGAVVISQVSDFNHFVEGRVLAPPILLIVTGIIVFLVASLGCFGAIRESRKMLIAFAVCLLIIFIMELAAGIAAACFKNDFQMETKRALRASLKSYNLYEADKAAWDNVQTKLQCCGIDGPNDWLTDSIQRSLPASCCYARTAGANPPSAEICRKASPSADYVYHDGCFEKMEMKVNGAANVLIGVGIGIAFVEIIGIVLACWLAAAIKKDEDGK